MTPRTKSVKTEVKIAPNPYGILKEAPPFPDDLSPKAQLKWAKIAPAACAVGTFSGADVEALGLLCETLAQESYLRDVLEREGFTIPTGSGEGSKSHPAARLLAETRTQASNLLASFGLTPRGRGQLKIQAPVDLEENPFALADKMRRRK